MLREVVGAIMAAFVGLIILWFMIPMLTVAKDSMLDTIDTSDPIITQVVELGDIIYGVLGFIVFGVIAFIILSYATRRSPFDEG